ncbi:MAG: hypothetical protein AAGA10_26640, partial [Bacteroidota bacterium]
MKRSTMNIYLNNNRMEMKVLKFLLGLWALVTIHTATAQNSFQRKFQDKTRPSAEHLRIDFKD